MRNTLKKEERLSSRKAIEMLFAEGYSVTNYPVKLIFKATEYPQKFPNSAMFVAPKKKYKRAHDRNLLKRRMKEAYRQLKHPLYEFLTESDKKLNTAFIYIDGEIKDYNTIRASVEYLINQCINKLNQSSSNKNIE